jgi:hypothetical protein
VVRNAKEVVQRFAGDHPHDLLSGRIVLPSLGLREAATGNSGESDRMARGIVDGSVPVNETHYNVYCTAPEPAEGLLSISIGFALFLFDGARDLIDPRQRRLMRFVP